MITLINEPPYVPGGLWFVFDKALQPFIPGWIQSKLAEVSHLEDRNTYFNQTIVKGEKYGQSIHARSTHGNTLVVFYTLYDEWRVGWCCLANAYQARVQADIIAAVTQYKQAMMGITVDME